MGAQIAHDPGGAAREIVRLQAENRMLREAITKAPHPLHCAASSPMWPGPCSCWKSRASIDEQGLTKTPENSNPPKGT